MGACVINRFSHPACFACSLGMWSCCIPEFLRGKGNIFFVQKVRTGLFHGIGACTRFWKLTLFYFISFLFARPRVSPRKGIHLLCTEGSDWTLTWACRLYTFRNVACLMQSIFCFKQ